MFAGRADPPAATSILLHPESKLMQATLSATTDVLERADVLTEDQLDTLPVGMIQLDRDGTVLKFNQTESDLARVQKTEAIGRSFFDEVAPCTKVQEFYGRFVEGVQNRTLHTVFPYQFRFRAPLLDLDYAEDSACGCDMNVVMTGAGSFVEVQGTAEGETFSRKEMDALLALAAKGIAELIGHQKRALQS